MLEFTERGGVQGGVRRGEPAYEGAGAVGLVGEVDLPAEAVAVEDRTELTQIVGDPVRQDDVEG